MLAGSVNVLVLVMSLLQGCAFLSGVQNPTPSSPQIYERRCGAVTPMEPLDMDSQVVPDDRAAVMRTQFSPAAFEMATALGVRSSKVLADRSQFFKDLPMPFYGYNRPGAKVSGGVRDSFWLQGMQAGFKGVFDCIKTFSETEQTEDLKKMTVPTLFIHGDDDQIVPIAASAQAAVKIAPKAQLKVYPGAPHGLCTTHKDQVNTDLLAFFKA